MEVGTTTLNRVFYLNFKNTTDNELFLLLEPCSYDETIKSGIEFKIIVSTNSQDDLHNFFHLEYGENQLSVFFEFYFLPQIFYKIRLEVDKKVVYDYQL